MADLNHLGSLKSSEPLDLSIYKDAQEFRLPKKGRYTVQAPDSFPAEAFGKTQADFLSATVDPTIIGPTNEGYKLRFTRVSAKTWTDKASGKPVSQIGQYLRAAGQNAEVEGDPQAQADAIEQTANAVYQVDIDWRVFNTATGFQLEGMEKFPSDGNGGHQSWVVDPSDIDDKGEPKRLRANAFVRRYVPATI